MQRNNMAEKTRVEIDGNELPGLVRFGEIALEKGQIDVPEQKRVRKISDGVSTIPAIELVYSVKRDSETLAFLRDWYVNNETKDVTKIRTDGHGVEFARTLLPDCECVRYVEPEYTAEGPTYAQVPITIIPWEVTPIDSQ